MAGPERFELPTSSFEDLLSIQLNYGPIRGRGYWDRTSDNRVKVCGVTATLTPNWMVSLLGFEPRPHGPKPRMQPDNTLERWLVVMERVELSRRTVWRCCTTVMLHYHIETHFGYCTKQKLSITVETAEMRFYMVGAQRIELWFTG